VTGTLFAPVLRTVTSGWVGVEVVAIANRFFGETVTVAGLLTGTDVVSGLEGVTLGERVVLPPAMFGGPAGQTIDEMVPDQIARALGRSVAVGFSR
jgi:NifB/MoaA-like Fe-S oxidoreductase